MGSKTNNSVNVRQNSGGTSQNQKWKLETSGSGFVLVSAASPSGQRFVLDVSGGRAANGSNVQLYKANNTAAQRFVFTRLANAAVKHETPLEKGEYVIQGGVGGAYVIDVSGGSSRDGANVQIFSYNGTKAQKWKVDYDENGFYTFTSLVSGNARALDVSGGKAGYSRNVQQFKSNKTNAQKWIVTKVGNQYKLASAIDPMFVLDVSGARAANGSNVQLYADNGTKAQRFTFLALAANVPTNKDVEDGVYAISMKSNGSYVLDVSGGSTSNNANVQLYKSNDTTAQRWGVMRNTNGLYSIFNMASGKMLDVSGGSPMSGVNAQQYTSNDSRAQLWSIVKNAKDGSFTIRSGISGMALDVSGGTIGNSSNIQVYTPNDTAAQKFNFISKPLVEERAYTILTMRNPALAVDVPNAVQDNGKALQVYSANDTLAQHVLAKRMSDGSYTFQLVNSSKYLTAENSKVVQRAATSNKAQQWKVSLVKGGVMLTNVATGTPMGVAASNPKNGTALVMSSASNVNSKMSLKTCDLIGAGIYTFRAISSKSGRVLDVANGSWDNGTNAQIYAANNTNAQKFLVKHISGGNYRIVMVLSGLAVEANGTNVDVRKWSGGDNQLWKPILTNDGITFQNKNSGLMLEVASGADKNSANVDHKASTTSYSQAWKLTSTQVNWTDLNSIGKLIRSVSGAGSVKSTFDISSANMNNLMNALRRCWNAGFDVGFIMTDLQTGNTVSLNADRIYYGACTMKAPYITWIFQELLEKGRISWGSVEDYIRPAIIDSENSTYLALRDRFGNDEFEAWLRGVGVYNLGYNNYDFYSPRTLQLMWSRILAYEQSNGRYVGLWREIFGQTHASPIADALRSQNAALYSKPGWYPIGSEYGTLSDSGMVVEQNGRRYFLTIMSTIDCYNEYDMHCGVARALDAIFRASPSA